MTLLTNRYEYKKLSRTNHNESRVYLTPDGNKVPSVTTVLDKTADKTFLHEWRKRVGKEKAQQISSEASGRGTRMHKFLENYILSGEWQDPGTNPYSIQANKMARVIRDNAFGKINEFLGIEVQLYVPNLYAGTTDLIAVVDGKISICDFKQTNKPKKSEWIDDYRIQLVAYSEAHNELYDTNISDGYIFMCSSTFDYKMFSIHKDRDNDSDNYDFWKDKWYDRLYNYYEQQN